MKIINANELKRYTRRLGAELCNVEAVERFADAPAGFHPNDVFPECKTVLVIAMRFPGSTLGAPSPAAYTFVRNQLTGKMDAITYQLAVELEDSGYRTMAIPSSDPYDCWDADRRHGQGILSLKHAAVLAGLGKLGKNTLLVNRRFGNMLWLGAVISDLDLETDKLADYDVCQADCRVCLDSCPANALDGVTIDQRKCRAISAKCTEGGGWVYACNLCRRVCPNRQGISLASRLR